MNAACGFVTCVEAGPLESMVVRLCESIRAFGGVRRKSTIYAVSPRFSPPLARPTVAAFDRLGVRHVVKPGSHRYGWYHFLNKPLSMLAASEAGTDEMLVWLDADTLLVREPVGLHLNEDRAAGVCSPCHDIIGSTGTGDPRDNWWREICGVAGVELDALPLIKTQGSDRRIRLYLQAGVFGVRRGSGVAEAYLEMCERLLSSRITLDNGPHWLEQIALGLALVAGSFKWQEWPWAVNYAVASFLPDRYARSEFADAQILHYHDAMTPAHFPAFLGHVKPLGGQLVELLERLGPVTDPQSSTSKMIGLPAKWNRKLQRKLHVLRSRKITA